MKNKVFLFLCLTAYWRESQGIPSPSILHTCQDTFIVCKYGSNGAACTCGEAAAIGWCDTDTYTKHNCRITCGLCKPGYPNSVPVVTNEVPVAVGYQGPCDPNPCGPGNTCEVQGGAGLCKVDMKAFFGDRNVSSSLPDAPPREEGSEVEAALLTPVTDAPMKAVAAEVDAPAIVPIAGEKYAAVTDAPIRPIAATPKTNMVVQLGPIAEFPVVAPEPPIVAAIAPLVEDPIDQTPKVAGPIIATSVTSAPVAPMAKTTSGHSAAPPIADMGPTAAPPIAGIQSDQVTDSPIVPIAMTPDAIVAPPPIAEGVVPPPEGRDNPAGWGYKHGPCEPNPCGPNTKCHVAPNGLARCRCMENYVPLDNTIVGCKPMCMSNEECPGDFYCKGTKCLRVCGPGACGLKADCDGYKNRAVCNCPAGYTGDPDKQCTRDNRNLHNETGRAAIGRFVVLDIHNRLPESEDDEPIQVVYMDTGLPVKEEEAADALESLAIANEVVAAEAAAAAEKLVGKENNAVQDTVSMGLLLLPLILILQI